MKKISQYWIEDPLRAVSQPVQFTVEGNVDISAGMQFVNKSRNLNTSNLPVFYNKQFDKDAVYVYSRMYNKESVSITRRQYVSTPTVKGDVKSRYIISPCAVFGLYDVSNIDYLMGYAICSLLDWNDVKYVQMFDDPVYYEEQFYTRYKDYAGIIPKVNYKSADETINDLSIYCDQDAFEVDIDASPKSVSESSGTDIREITTTVLVGGR